MGVSFLVNCFTTCSIVLVAGNNETLQESAGGECFIRPVNNCRVASVIRLGILWGFPRNWLAFRRERNTLPTSAVGEFLNTQNTRDVFLRFFVIYSG